MSLREKIEEDLKKAIREKNQDELRALRDIKSLILLAETEKGRTSRVSENDELKLLMKAAKQRKESAQVYQEQGREDLLKKEEKELEIIERYLPSQLSDEELVKELNKIIEEVGASDIKDMGKVMGIATKKLAGQADGKRISEIVKQLLSQK